MDQEVGEVVVDSHLGLEGRARQALVGLCPTPTLVDPPQTLVESPATGSQIASLTGHSESFKYLGTITGSLSYFPFHSNFNVVCLLLDLMAKNETFNFYRQCQGTPGRCVDPCTNNVETGIFKDLSCFDDDSCRYI